MPEIAMPLDQATVSQLAQRYLDGSKPGARRIEMEIAASVPSVKESGFVPHELFLKVCLWKSTRIQGLVAANIDEFVEEAIRIALSTEVEQMRVEVLRLLRGVDYPVASVFLHWFGSQDYPILDRLALAALGILMPARYTYEFWQCYVEQWREAKSRAGTENGRTFDRALWQWGKDHLAKV